MWMVFGVANTPPAVVGSLPASWQDLAGDYVSNIEPERYPSMPDTKHFLGSSQDATDIYAAQFLA